MRLSPFAIVTASLGCGLGYAICYAGGVIAWGWNICLLLAGLVATAWFLIPAGGIALAPPLWITRALLFLPAWVALQLLPLPLAVVGVRSPARSQVAHSLGFLFPDVGLVMLSASAPATYAYLLRILAYVLVFLLLREITLRTRERWPWTPFLPLLALAVMEASLGLSQQGQEEGVLGTYGSRNHFSDLLEMILPGTAAMGLALMKSDGFRPPSLLRTLAGAAGLFAATSIFVAIVAAQSKSGFIAAIGGLLTMGVVGLAAQGLTRRKGWGVLALVIVAAVVFLYLPSNEVISGFGNALNDPTGEGRIPVWTDTLRLISDYPLFGTDLGTYVDVFQQYQTQAGAVVFAYAHNDYLELLAALGLPGFAALLCIAIPLGFALRRSLRRDAGADLRYLRLGCIGGMVAIAIHSVTDFNLYLPANAMVLAWIA